MKIALLGVLLGFLLIGVALIGLRRSNAQDEDLAPVDTTDRKIANVPAAKYRVKGSLMSEPEQVLFYRLKEAFPALNVFSQVSLNQLIYVSGATASRRERATMFNAINGKSLDFVVCGPSGAALAAIELDDSTHNRPDRIKADMQKNSALASAGVPVHRFNVKEMPSAKRLGELLSLQKTQGSQND